MSPSKVSLLLIAAAAVGFGVTASRFANAATEKGQIGALGPNHGIVVDPKTFTITKGASKTDPTAHIVKLGAREVTAHRRNTGNPAQSSHRTAWSTPEQDRLEGDVAA